MKTLHWHPTNAPNVSKVGVEGRGRYDDVVFIDPLEGWAINNQGEICHTTDGGRFWECQLKLPDVWLRSLTFAPDSRIGVVGTLTPDQRLWRTDNGGIDWHHVDPGTLPDVPEQLCGLHAVHPGRIYGSGTVSPNRRAGVIVSYDGGRSWRSTCKDIKADNLIDIYFKSVDCGWVVGGILDEGMPAVTARKERFKYLRPVILYTEDGGQSWDDRATKIREQLPLGTWGWKISFLPDNEKVAFVSVQSEDAAYVLKSTDGGHDWEILTVQGNFDIEGVGFLTESHGWVGGWGPKVELDYAHDDELGWSSATFDGGTRWVDATDAVGSCINRFRFVRTKHGQYMGYAAGETIYRGLPMTIADPNAGGWLKRFGYRRPRMVQSRIPGMVGLRAISNFARGRDARRSDGAMQWDRPWRVDNGEIVIGFEGQPRDGDGTLTIFSRFGDQLREVAVTVSQHGEVRWDGMDGAGHPVLDRTGLYRYTLNVGGKTHPGVIRWRSSKSRRIRLVSPADASTN